MKAILILAGASLGAIVVLYVGMLYLTEDPTFDKTRQARYRSITNGMTKAEVIACFGIPPDSTNDYRALAHRCAEFGISDPTQMQYFTTWRNGINWEYTFAYNSKDEVIAKDEGGN